MKFWERTSETLTGVWEERYIVTEEQKPELLQNNQQCPKLNGKSDYQIIVTLTYTYLTGF